MNNLSLDVYKFLSRIEEVLDDDQISSVHVLSEQVKNAVTRASDIEPKMYNAIFEAGFKTIQFDLIIAELQKDRRERMEEETSSEEEEEETSSEEEDEPPRTTPSLATKLVSMLSKEHS